MSDMPRPWQFGIRHLLGAMFIVAVLSALIAPWVRGWSAGQWLVLGTQTAVVAATFATFMGGSEWSRRSVQKRLGELRFEVDSKTWGQDAWNRANAYAMLGLATLLLFLLTAATITSPRGAGPPHFQGVYAGLLAAIGFTQLLHPPNRMLIGEQGVAIEGRRFVPWERLLFSYVPGGWPSPLLLKTTGWAFELLAPAELEPSLIAFLSERAKSWENPTMRK